MSTNLYLENTEPTVREGRALRTKMAVDFSAASSVTLPATGTGAQTITSTSANALTVGANGTTNPVLQIDDSTASVATGLKVTGAASGGGLAVTLISSGTNESLNIDAKGTGQINLNAVSAGTVQIGPTTHGIAIFQPSGALNVYSANAQALSVGNNGTNNPALNVDVSTASAVAGLNIKGAVTGGTVALSAIDSGSNTNLSIDAKGTGTITIGGTSTGNITLGSTSNNVNLAQTEITATNNATASFLTNGVAGTGGPTTAAQHGWAVIYVGGNKRWVPVWL